jgi:hypothetical protein
LASPNEKNSSQNTHESPAITLSGSSGGRIQLSKIESAKKLETTSDKYDVESFTVYFAGANFPHVKGYSQTGATFTSDLQKEWKNIKPGTSVVFDKVKVKDRNGNISTAEKAPGYLVW